MSRSITQHSPTEVMAGGGPIAVRIPAEHLQQRLTELRKSVSATGR